MVQKTVQNYRAVSSKQVLLSFFLLYCLLKKGNSKLEESELQADIYDKKKKKNKKKDL